MHLTYEISADSAMTASSIARSRAASEGWSSVNVISTVALGPRTFSVSVVVSGRR